MGMHCLASPTLCRCWPACWCSLSTGMHCTLSAPSSRAGPPSADNRSDGQDKKIVAVLVSSALPTRFFLQLTYGPGEGQEDHANATRHMQERSPVCRGFQGLRRKLWRACTIPLLFCARKRRKVVHPPIQVHSPGAILSPCT